MTTFLNYLIEVNLGIILFFLVYRFLLKKETNFGFRRLFLLESVIVSILFPLITIQEGVSVVPSLSQALPTHWLPELVIGNQASILEAENIANSLSVWTVIGYSYLAGVIIFFLKFITQLYQIIRLIKFKKPSSQLIEVNNSLVAFSFFHYIFIGNSSKLSIDEKKKIIDHEQVHIRLLHTVDILLFELVHILLWFNPLLKAYKNELKEVHEFQADQKTVQESDVKSYCNLLAKVALESSDLTLVNHFSNSLIIKRIRMMNTLKHSMHWWKPTVLLPIMVMFFIAVACQDQVMDDIKEVAKNASMTTDIPEMVSTRVAALQKQNPTREYIVLRFDDKDYEKMKDLEMGNTLPSRIEVIKIFENNFEKTGASRSYIILEKSETANQLAEVTKSEGEVFLIVEETAQPEEGMDAFYQKMASLIRYPEEARKNKIEGRVFIEFIIETDGRLTDLKVLKGIGSGCDEEAMRALAVSGNWIPGKQKDKNVRQRMVLPVTFKLNSY